MKHSFKDGLIPPTWAAHNEFTASIWTRLYSATIQTKPMLVRTTTLVIAWRSETQWWEKWQLSTFDLDPSGEGHGVQGQICDILRPQLAINRFLPLWPHRFPHFGYIHLGGEGVGGGSDIRLMSSIRPICQCRCPPLLKPTLLEA